MSVVRSDARFAQSVVVRGDARTNVACLRVESLHTFIKHSSSGETELCVGKRRRRKETGRGASEALASCLSYAESLCWPLNLSLQARLITAAFPSSLPSHV